ncbi:unnamed protein product [Brassicogethes aeneus]|uniref:D-isomer specific 2-hydroxyacid dehydrogenase NAD-binding domain-containing protein n=1 Tax=Brassicogethes aeneus TaxID=1431903 RepID=A0A9P0FLG7_BRAAE|nr:unnamed protein product [Brassicogethes aeneus]
MHGIISVLTNTKNLVKELQRILPNQTFKEVKTPENDADFKQSRIIIADFDLIGPHLYDLPNAKWVQGTWAGTDKLAAYLNKGEPNFEISRFSGDVFGRIMGEYVLGNVVNFERDFFRVRENQRGKLWCTEGKIEGYRSIGDLTFGVMGLGNIGGRIGRYLSLLGGTIYGYGRRNTYDDKEYPFIEKYFTKNTLKELLRSVDYLINVMPKTAETTDLLSDDILENCKEKGAIFINIGRGNVILEESLIKALDNKWINGAILDVFQKEPLDKNSKLWTYENVFITPHVSGFSNPKDVALQFQKNLTYYEETNNIPFKLNFEKGY